MYAMYILKSLYTVSIKMLNVLRSFYCQGINFVSVLTVETEMFSNTFICVQAAYTLVNLAFIVLVLYITGTTALIIT